MVVTFTTVRVLLSEGSGLTARQVASQLGDAGHEVHVLSPDPFCLARFTRRVKRVWRVPSYGDDPLVWLSSALDVAEASEAAVLFPTQEQVAVLSACSERVADAGVRTVVPSFGSLRRVQDKVSAFATLEEFGLPQPDSAVLATRAATEAWDRFPVYIKEPIGTATSGVRLVRDGQTLQDLVATAAATGTFEQGGLLAQEPVAGPLAMVQSVFSDGGLVAIHANLRVREGASGGASHKRSLDLPVVREQLRMLGAELAWHGALSADVILADSGPVFIDMNPRLVEPGNARRSGVDLVSPMLELALGSRPAIQPLGAPGVSTHQLLLAVLGAAQKTGERRVVYRELVDSLRHTGDYDGSWEELTPLHGDWRAALPVAIATSLSLIYPPLEKLLSSGAVRNYALSPHGWQQLLDYCR
jgi:glutathione synthase/RimK-type ligase-like ATP-grasp enzyme